MIGTVSLLTINLETGEEKLTTGYEREELQKWIAHSKRECAEGILSWVLVEHEELK